MIRSARRPPARSAVSAGRAFFVRLSPVVVLAGLALTLLTLPVHATAANEPDGAVRKAVSGTHASPPRIVSLSPAITESLFDIGGGDAIVGTVQASNRPAAAAMIPRIGSHSGLDYERILTLRPTLAIAWGGGTSPTWIERLRALGLPVAIIDVYTLADIATSLEHLGKLTGRENGAAAAAAKVRARLERLPQDAPPRRAFYQVWPEPLMTLNGRHVISDAMRRCGAINVFEDLAALVPVVGAEDVLRAQPQAIIAARANDDTADPLVRWRAYQTLPAVRESRLILLDADRMARPTLAMLDEVDVLCAALQR